MTPKAKIFSQLKKSEGNLSSNDLSGDHGRYGQFAAGISDNTDSNCGRFSLERPQAGVNGHYDAHNSMTNLYLQGRSSHALRTAPDDGPVVEPLTRLDGNSAANRDPVPRGRNEMHHLYDLQEEGYSVDEGGGRESRSVGSEDLSQEEEEDRVDLVSEVPGLEEIKSPGDQTECRVSEQTRKCSSDIREQRRRAQLRRVIPEESETSEEEENVRTETSRRKQQAEVREESIDQVDVRLRQAPAGHREDASNGSKPGRRQSSEEEKECSEDGPAMALRSRRKHDLEEEVEGEVSRRTKMTSRNRKQASDNESVDEVEARDCPASKERRKVPKEVRGLSSEEEEESKVRRRTNLRSRSRREHASDEEFVCEVNARDAAVSVERSKVANDGRRLSSEEDEECEVRRRTNLRSQNRREHASDDESVDGTSDAAVSKERRRVSTDERRQSSEEEDEEEEVCNVSRRTKMTSRNRRNHVSDSNDDTSVETIVITTHAPQERRQNGGKSRLQKEHSDYREYKDDRPGTKLTSVKRVTNDNKSRQADKDGETLTKNTSDIDFPQKESKEQMETQPTARRHSKRLDDIESTTRSTTRSTSSRKNQLNHSPVVVVSSSSDDSADSAEPDKAQSSWDAEAETSHQRVTRNMSAREKSQETADHVQRKKGTLCFLVYS